MQLFPRILLSLTVLAIATLVLGQASAQMVDPSIDRSDEPFCYFSHPTDVIGVMDGKEGTLVTPEGYFYTGFGEIMFFTGNPPQPVNQRVKTLYKGYLPVTEYSTRANGLDYQFRMYAATLDGNPESPLMNFVRVSVSNRERARQVGYLAIATRYQNEANTSWGGVGDNRFGRPAKAKRPGQFEQAGEQFDRDWEYAFQPGSFLRDGKVMYLFPEDVPHVIMMTFKTGYNSPPDKGPGKQSILPTTPVGIVYYELGLKPGESKELIFKIPYAPIPEDESLVSQLKAASYDAYLHRTVAFWDSVFSGGMELRLPEDKVVNTFKANLAYDLIARNKDDDFYIQKVNEFQYDAFWLRDASYIIRSYDLTGYHDVARQCLEFFPQWQQSDGNFVSQGGQFDGWGQSLWAFGEHYRITHDRAFAEEVYPLIVKAIDWLRTARQGDPLMLMPETSPGDNEDIIGHVTGHNFWALVGLKNAIVMASDLGKSDDSVSFQEEYDNLFAALQKRLAEITAKTGGYIPPGLDSLGGQDWDNMSALYPEILLSPSDPMVSATLRTTRAKYKEGLMTYGDGRWLHHYLTMANTETEIVRGDQQLALEELYAILVHTGSTHTGFEFCIRPWGDRDFGMNLAPHGWFAANYRAVLRNMMVREQGDQLHLLSCVSPEWIRDGSTIGVDQAPTNFGNLGFDLKCKGQAATLSLKADFVAEPKDIILHLPWFMETKSVSVGGKQLAVHGGAVSLPRGTKTVEIVWSKRGGTPELNYARAVRDYKAEYRKRYDDFIKNGKLPD